MPGLVSSVVLRLLSVRIGYTRDHHVRPWEDLTHHGDPVPLLYEDVDDIYKDDDVTRSFEEALDPEDQEHDLWHHRIYEDLVLPIACAFVHYTEWVPLLRRFRRDSGPWLTALKTECCNHRYHKYVEQWIDNENWFTAYDAENMWQQKGCFWDGFDESVILHGSFCYLFIVTLDHYMSLIGDLIYELDQLFHIVDPESFDATVSKRIWEVVVVDWLKDQSQEADIHYNGSNGEGLYFREFILPAERTFSNRYDEMLRSMGWHTMPPYQTCSSLIDKDAHRKNWKELGYME